MRHGMAGQRQPGHAIVGLGELDGLERRQLRPAAATTAWARAATAARAWPRSTSHSATRRRRSARFVREHAVERAGFGEATPRRSCRASRGARHPRRWRTARRAARPRARDGPSAPSPRTRRTPRRTATAGVRMPALMPATRVRSAAPHATRPSLGTSTRPSPSLQCVIPRRPREVDGAHLDAVPLGIFDQRARRVEPHRLRVEDRRAVLGRVVVPQVRGGVHDQREARRMALGKAVVGEGVDLVVNAARRRPRGCRCAPCRR